MSPSITLVAVADVSDYGTSTVTIFWTTGVRVGRRASSRSIAATTVASRFGIPGVKTGFGVVLTLESDSQAVWMRRPDSSKSNVHMRLVIQPSLA